MLSANRLIAEHMEIQQIAADLLHHAQARPVDPAQVAKARWALSRVLLAHLTKEDVLLYPMLRRGPCPDAVTVANRFADELGGLADAFKNYMRHWNSDHVVADPDGFEHDTGRIISALARRIAYEEAELYRHIPDGGTVRTVDAGARAA